jgi:tetratricopeptide (TPR) repeat protein
VKPLRAWAGGLLCALCLGATAALADQRDPRLPDLFSRLASAADVGTAGQLELQIWEIWGEIDDPAAASLLAAGTEAMGRRAWPSALESFNELVAAQPEFAEGWNKRATLYYLMNDYERSVLDIQQALRLEPRHFGALSGLGLIFMAVGKPESAIRSFEAGLAIHPYLTGARQHIEVLRQQLRGDPL